MTRRTSSPESGKASDRLFRAEYGLGLVCIHSLDGYLLSVSPAGAKALGYEPHEMVSRAMQDFLPEDVRDQLPAYLDHIRQNGTASGLMRVLTRSGEERILAYSNICRQEAGEPVCVLGHAADITELKRAEHQLRAAEERFCSLVQCGSDAVTIVRADGSIQYVSPAVQRTLGYSPEQVVGRNVFDYVHPDDLFLARRTFRAALQKPGHEIPLEVRLRNFEGVYIPLDVTANNLLPTPGVAGVVIAAKNISGRKLVRLEPEEGKKELKQWDQEWSRAISAFASSILGCLAVLFVHTYRKSRTDKRVYRMMLRAISTEAANNKIIVNDYLKSHREGFVPDLFVGAAVQCCASPLFIKQARPSDLKILSTYVHNIRVANAYQTKTERFWLEGKGTASGQRFESFVKHWCDHLKHCRESIEQVLALAKC